uniref:T-cell antigen CD7 n=1 Tax=Sus scrofa TaxID=9823 RepID=A0A481B5A3_PIG
MARLLGLPLLPLLLALSFNRAAQEVWQSPGHAIALEGGSIHITCSSRGPLLGIYLKRVLPKASNVIYYEEGREATVDERFRGRVTFSGLQHNLTISVHRLQLPDTGAYACQAIMDSEVWGPGTLVVVTDKLPQAANSCREAQWTHMALSAALAAVCFLAGLGLGAVCARRGTWGWGQCVRAEGHRSVWPRMSSTSQLLSGSREEPAGVPRELAVWESPAPPHALHPVSGAGRVHSRVHVGRNLRTEPQQGRAWGPGRTPGQTPKGSERGITI